MLPSSFDELLPIRIRGRGEKTVGLRKETLRTLWFKGVVDDEMVSCIAIISIKGDYEVTRLKAGYVLPEWRGLGFGTRMIDFGMDYCINSLPKCKEIQAYSVDPPFLLAKGWRLMGRGVVNEVNFVINR